MTKYVSFKNGKIRYTDTGKGRAVIFLHGFLENLEMWRYFHTHLPKKYRSICIDLPGHGKSDNFGYNHSMELMAEGVKAVMKQERLRKVILVGHSMGGYVAMAFAELFPDNTKGVLLYFSSAAGDNKEKKQNRNRAIELVKRDHQSFVRNSIPLLFTAKNRIKYHKTIRVLVKKALTLNQQSIIAALEGMRDRSDREILLKFAPFPVGFIIGSEDPVLNSETLLAQAKITNNHYLVLLEKTGHMGFIENKKASFLGVKNFLKTIYR